jgi:uncharacterized membrane protein HdeD (DUF308 family)
MLGLVLLVVGVFLAVSANNTPPSGFDEPSTISSAAVQLLIGAFVVIMGVLLMFLGAWTSKRSLYAYY